MTRFPIYLGDDHRFARAFAMMKMNADEDALEPCSICYEPTVDWLATREEVCCGKLVCKPSLATLYKTPVPGSSGRMQAEFCASCRQKAPRSNGEIEKCLRERASKGHAWAQGELGMSMYDGNDGVRVDEAAGTKLLESAVAQGDVGSHYTLGLAKELGRSGGVDEDAAFVLYRRAAAQGHPHAMHELASAL